MSNQPEHGFTDDEATQPLAPRYRSRRPTAAEPRGLIYTASGSCEVTQAAGEIVGPAVRR